MTGLAWLFITYKYVFGNFEPSQFIIGFSMFYIGWTQIGLAIGFIQSD